MDVWFFLQCFVGTGECVNFKDNNRSRARLPGTGVFCGWGKGVGGGVVEERS